MRGKPERTRVEIKESSTEDSRIFNVTLTASLSDFQLSDLLKQRGIIDGLQTELKEAVRRATEDYLKSAETLISSLASPPKHGVFEAGKTSKSQSSSILESK
jgi:HPt (histidine-containing phosphotransfer) domain-containing protein